MAKQKYGPLLLIISAIVVVAGLMVGTGLLNVNAGDIFVYGTGPVTLEDYDKNSDGIIDPEELSFYTFQKWDSNLDGLLVEDEWQDGVFSWYAPFTAKYPGDFTLWDVNGDAQLELDEVQRLLTRTEYHSYWDFSGNGTVENGEVADSLYRIFNYDRTSPIEPYEWEIFLD